MKRLKISAAALALALLLTACGGGQQESGDLLTKAAGLDADTALLTVDGQEQPSWRYLYWLARACGELWEQYEQAGQTPEWSAPLPEGGTLADYAKAQALADAALCAVVEEWAQLYGCAAQGSARLESELLTPEQSEALGTVGLQYRALYDLNATPDSLLAPVEGELERYAEHRGLLRADRILAADNGDREAARQRAGESFAALNGAEDPEAAFAELAAAGDDPAGPRDWEQGTVDAALWLAASELAEGQISGILESEEGFSILRRLPVDADALAADYFDYLLQTAASESEIETTEAYDRLSVPAFYSALRG